VTLYQSSLINVVYRMCGDPILAEDAAQEAFFRAWKHIGRFDPRYPFRNWLYRIAINTALDFIRREKETVVLEDLPLQTANGLPEPSLERREQTLAVQQAILALPEAQRSALILREYEGLSYAEISAVLGIPVGTVMSRLNYARSSLRAALADYVEET
jgi:RNA polymerase sigma-70 factor (ECF subfamily)